MQEKHQRTVLAILLPITPPFCGLACNVLRRSNPSPVIVTIDMCMRMHSHAFPS
jgi:hypothetical protein